MIHTVKAGETLTQISQDYRTSLASILAANPGIQPDHLFMGQQIVIPGLPEPDTIPYRIEISTNNRRSVYIETISFKNNTQLQLDACFTKHQ